MNRLNRLVILALSGAAVCVAVLSAIGKTSSADLAAIMVGQTCVVTNGQCDVSVVPCDECLQTTATDSSYCSDNLDMPGLCDIDANEPLCTEEPVDCGHQVICFGTLVCLATLCTSYPEFDCPFCKCD